MNKKRIIARLDVKNNFVIKGIHLEGLRKIGDPNELAIKYYQEGVDEIIFMDAVAAYYDRNSLSEVIHMATNNVFVPITVGGGIRKIDDIQQALDSGADKIAINTQAIRNKQFIAEASRAFGSQCIVASIDAKRTMSKGWEAYFDNGREPSGIDAIEWAKELEQLGAGEIMLTSIDKEGTKKGFDKELVASISSILSIPIIASGGAGTGDHIAGLIKDTRVDAVAIASLFHYNLLTVDKLKASLIKNDIRVRN